MENEEGHDRDAYISDSQLVVFPLMKKLQINTKPTIW